MIYLLPYVEQQGLYSNLQIGGGTGYGNSANGALYTNVVIKLYRCPASTLPAKTTSSVPGSGTLMLPTYVAVSGADNNALAGTGFTESRLNTPGGATGCCSGGNMSGGGALYANSQTRLPDITDGTSNTIVISEQADYLTTANGTKQPWNAAGPHGWTIGHGNQQIPGPLHGSGGDNRVFNCTTIRYMINQKAGWTDAPGNCASQGVCDNTGQNIPLNSTHPSAVNVLMGDGSARMLSDSTALGVLALLATRDDGRPLPNF